MNRSKALLILLLATLFILLLCAINANAYNVLYSDELKWEDVTEEEYPDLFYLTRTICGEAQNCGLQESLYVGSVIVNRKNSDRFPNTIKEVCLQSGQYACWEDGNAWKDPTEDNFEAAKQLLRDGSIFPEDIVWQAQVPQGSYTYYISEWGHYYCGG